MNHAWLGLIELFVVLLFVAGWGILELVTLRMDRRRTAHAAAAQAAAAHTEPAESDRQVESAAAAASKESSRHPER